MTGNDGIDAAATWHRNAATIYVLMMQIDHSCAADGRRRDRHTAFFAEPDVL
jgi:hypothetical protein